MNSGYFQDCKLKIAPNNLPLKKLVVTEKEKITAQQFQHPLRKKNFLLARHHSHLLLKGLGYATKTIKKKKNGAIDWEENIKGSISHCSEWIAVCLSSLPTIVSIGLDIEKKNRTIQPKIYKKIRHSKEKWDFSNPQETLKIFCLKEAIIKCLGQQEILVGFQEIFVHSLAQKLFSIPSKEIFQQTGYLQEEKDYLLASWIIRSENNTHKKPLYQKF